MYTYNYMYTYTYRSVHTYNNISQQHMNIVTRFDII